MKKNRLQTFVEILPESLRDELEKRRRGILSQQILASDNRSYAGTRGVSVNNCSLGFAPGYLDTHTGHVYLSRFADGRPAPIHVLDGLPACCVSQRDLQGHVLKTRPGVIAGFIRKGRFYTRDQAAGWPTH